MLNQGMKYYGLFGGLVELFQYVIGIGLIVLAYVWITARKRETRRAALYLSAVGLAVGAFMNMIFYFAVGPMDTWIAAGNAVMFWIQLVLIYGFVNLLMSKEE
jgi:multisubunit Na+/H+ antiporter MnhB subunit